MKQKIESSGIIAATPGRTSRWLTVAACAALLAGCSNEELLPQDGSTAPVSFTAAVQTALPAAKPHTRTTISNGQTVWKWGDRVGVYMYEAGSDKIIAGAENRPYTVNNTTGVLSPDGTPIYYPKGQAVDFAAYYPYLTDLQWVTISLEDQSSTSKQCAIDYLYSDNAKNIQPDQNPVALEFRHLMSKVKFDITLGEGLAGGKITKATLYGQYTDFQVFLQIGSIPMDPNAIPAPVSMLKSAASAGADATFTALIAPVPVPSQDTAVGIIVNGREYIGTFSMDFVPESNTMYVFPVTVQNSRVTVGTATIKPWEELEPVKGEVE